MGSYCKCGALVEEDDDRPCAACIRDRDIIEVAAKAIHATQPEYAEWDRQPESFKEQRRMFARAALGTMTKRLDLAESVVIAVMEHLKLGHADGCDTITRDGYGPRCTCGYDELQSAYNARAALNIKEPHP